MSRPTVAIGLVGVANHGNTIFNAIRDAGNLRLVSCFDINRDAAERAASIAGARVARDYDDLVADPAIEAVALVTPNQLHAEQLRKAAAAGKHVFVEKPIANGVADARAMIAVMQQAGLILMVGHNTRRRQVFRRAKELLSQGILGTVVGIEGNLSRPAGLQPGLPPWKADPSSCPLLPMTQLGIHLIDTVEYLVDRIEAVSCVAANVAMPGSVFDTTAAVLKLRSGVPFVLSSYYVSPDAYFLRIYGTRGLLHCYPTSLRLEQMEDGAITNRIDENFTLEGANSYILQMKEFGDCVREHRPPETGGEEGLRALAAIEAMTRSVRSGSMVSLSEVLQ